MWCRCCWFVIVTWHIAYSGRWYMSLRCVGICQSRCESVDLGESPEIEFRADFVLFRSGKSNWIWTQMYVWLCSQLLTFSLDFLSYQFRPPAYDCANAWCLVFGWNVHNCRRACGCHKTWSPTWLEGFYFLSCWLFTDVPATLVFVDEVNNSKAHRNWIRIITRQSDPYIWKSWPWWVNCLNSLT